MDQKAASTYMTIGMHTGIYMVTSILAEREPEWEKLKNQSAEAIQELSGMPAEDFATSMDGTIGNVRAQIRKRRDDAQA